MTLSSVASSSVSSPIGRRNRVNIQAILHNPGIALIDRVEQLREIDLDQVTVSEQEELERYIALHARQVQWQRKWLELGLPREVLISCPECVEILVTAAIAHQIVMFSNTSQQEEEKAVLLDHDHHPLIKMNGVWTRWEMIGEHIVYDHTKEYFVSKVNPLLVWNYISPDGFVQKDPYAQSLYPIAQICSERYQALVAHATTFWRNNEEVDPGTLKPCVLQIFTTAKDRFPRNWLTENALDLYSQHAGIRLVDSDGRIFSFGIEIDEKFRAYYHQFRREMLVTGNSRLVTPDYTEHHWFDRRRVTSIPITTERVQSILRFIHDANKAPGIPFCIVTPNCTTVAKKVLHLAGVELDCRMKLTELPAACLPSANTIPYVGSSLFYLASKVRTVSSSFFSTLERVAICKRAVQSILFPSSKITACVLNLLLLAFGAGRVVEPQAIPSLDEQKTISSLIPSWYDLFSEESLSIDHSFKLIQWQKRQTEATRVYYYEGKPKIYL